MGPIGSFMGLWVHLFTRLRAHGLIDSKVHGLMACHGIWVHLFMGARAHGLIGSKLHGFNGRGMQQWDAMGGNGMQRPIHRFGITLATHSTGGKGRQWEAMGSNAATDLGYTLTGRDATEGNGRQYPGHRFWDTRSLVL